MSDSPTPPWRALLEVLRGRRSRRFGLGMRMATGPMAYASAHPGLRLTEEEEALLAFAACGITGYALADLTYAPGEGGTIMAGLVGRTTPSGDAIQTCALIVQNEAATWYLRRPRDFPPEAIPDLIRLAEAEDYVGLYRRCRVRIGDGGMQPPLTPLVNINCNRWSLYDPAATYFLPVADLTLLYVNGLLEILNEDNGAFVVDERAAFRPAGLGRFARRRGGHLDDDPAAEKTLTIQQLETLVVEFAAAEAGMMLQNLALMTQALGLGGFPHWAAHPYGWFRALGFRMTQMPATRYLGMRQPLRGLARWLGRDRPVPLVVGLDADGEPLCTPYCPPHYASMRDAVEAVVALKWGPEGLFGGGARHSAWGAPEAVRDAAPPPSAAAVAATTAYCTYVHRRYGRFPAYPPPLRTLLGFQVNHVDVAFYYRFYRPEALTDLQRTHLRDWHGG